MSATDLIAQPDTSSLKVFPYLISSGAKALGRRCIAFSREQQVDRRTRGVDSPV
jgi:hypothetical protein